MKSYKKFMHDIREEWVDDFVPSTDVSSRSDIWKNPTSREWSEYASNLPTGYIAGFMYKNDVYYFSRGLHNDVLRHLKFTTDDTKVTKFRTKASAAGKMIKINSGGGRLSGISSDKWRKDYFKRMIDLYQHKHLNRYVEDSTNAAYAFSGGLTDSINFWGGEEMVAEFMDMLADRGLYKRKYG